ncbi:DUF3307 domain-containing protein [Oceanobacillus kapialis]|uniref:DUF3307 domain-containing protein n=1 Tax=Oceanobacillus kapialis TaxID=481353 RepID=UPI00384A9E57
MTTFLLMLLAHLIADFWLQSDKMVNGKVKYLKSHSIHHLLTTGIALLFIWSYLHDFQNVINYLIFPLAFIVMTHLLIDLMKIKLVEGAKKDTPNNLKLLGYFLLDQALHTTMIVVTCFLFFQMNLTVVTDHIENWNGMTDLLNTLLFLTIMYILATSVSGHIVKHIIGNLPSELANFEGELTLKNQMINVKETNQLKAENNLTEEYHYFTYSSPLRSRGKLIGYIERLLVILLTVVGAYPAITFIIAAKSIARFKQLDDRNWAEYFLLGTLSSILLGLLLGLVVQAIIM